jgi:hypothetical protein
MLGHETLDYFRFAIGPQNIDPPARTGIFPRHESWSLLGHPSNKRLWRPGSSQLSCHYQTDPLPIYGSADRELPQWGSNFMPFPDDYNPPETKEAAN